MKGTFRHALALGTLIAGSAATEQAAAEEPMGAPPPDLEKVAAGPAAPADAPEFDAAPQGTMISAAAGGLSSTGNSRLIAATVNAALDSRLGDNGFGASVLGNYGRGAPPGEALDTTVENVQGRLRYDRYVLDDASVFLIATGRRDRLQGVAFRLNLDPGFKYLFINRRATALWGELGYDFQYDRRTDEARLVLDEDGDVVETLDQTATDHSVRSFVGFRQAFSEDVALSTGLEYLQSFIDADRFRLNYDLLFTARIAGAFALGTGFAARYDNAPLPEKAELDTTTTLSLVYSYSTVEPEGG
jgi:putative salt-induced outer membrane protein YdiY